jgi:hypothetical protein
MINDEQVKRSEERCPGLTEVTLHWNFGGQAEKNHENAQHIP